MTPEERKGALVGLLGRLRTNAGSRLPLRSGDEEEFVPKSVIAARAAAAASAAESAAVARRDALDDAVGDLRPRFAPDDVPLETDPPPTAIPGSTPATLEEALRRAEEIETERLRAESAAAAEADDHVPMDSAPPTPRGEIGDEAPSIEMGDSSELELDLFDPFDEPTATGAPDEIEADILEVEPEAAAAPPPPPPAPRAVQPPRVAAQPPPAPAPPPPASLTRAISNRASPTIESHSAAAPLPPGSQPGAAARPVPPAPASAPAGTSKQVPPPPASAPRLDPRSARPVPAGQPVQPSAPPVSRVEPASSQPLSIELPFDEPTEERDDSAARAATDEEVRISDELEATVNMPPRKVDPLARTAQNPIPAAFERAVLRAEGALIPPMGEGKPAEAPLPPAPPAPPAPPPSDAPPEVASEEPVSSKQPRALDREGGDLDDALSVDDGDLPPQSGEIASQRQPASGQHLGDLDLDGATPSSDQSDAVAEEAMALLDAEAVPSSPPPTRPAVMGRRPVAVTSFLDVLDEALRLGQPGG